MTHPNATPGKAIYLDEFIYEEGIPIGKCYQCDLPNPFTNNQVLTEGVDYVKQWQIRTLGLTEWNNCTQKEYETTYSFPQERRIKALPLQAEKGVKYFIEDIDTNEWYCYPFELMPSVHSNKTGWDKPEPNNCEYWTKDPNHAFSFFKNKADAELFLKEKMDKKDLSFCKGETGFEMRNLKVTEHLFVDTPGNIQAEKREGEKESVIDFIERRFVDADGNIKWDEQFKGFLLNKLITNKG